MRNPCAFTLSLSLSLALALASIGILGMPLAAQASVYLPGATTNPDCAPTDPPATCGISTIVASSTANSIPYYAANGSALSATSTFQILANGTASTTNLIVVNSLTLGSLSGFLKATAGAIATALINLATDVTGILPVGNGGTGVASIASGYIPFGNNTGAIATSTALYFDSTNGRLGIGTSTPWAQLSVNPNGITGPAFAIGSSTATSFLVTNGGFVGIGTTSPFTNFSVTGNGYFSGALNVGDAATTRSNLGLKYAPSTDISAVSIPIATWGDSLTFGSFAQTPWPVQLAWLSKQYMVYNGGVGAETSTQIASRMLAATDKYSWPTVIWAGRNNVVSGSTVEADIASMVAALASVGNTNYLVLGILNASTTAEWSGGVTYNQINAINTYLASTYGSHYFDIRSYLVTNGLSNAGITPTADDTWNIAHDVPPDSLRYSGDTLHLNSTGYGIVAARVNANIDTLLGVTTSNFSSEVVTLGSLKTTLSNLSASGYTISGDRAFYATTTNFLTAVGIGAAKNMQSSALYNTAVGYQALFLATSSNATTNYSNTAVGYSALYANSSGYFNVAIGSQALIANTTGSNNAGVGYASLYTNTTGANNTAIGVNALQKNTTQSNNTAVGFSALYNLNGGTQNTGLGVQTLNFNVTGNYNTAIGYQAGYGVSTNSFSNNSLFGRTSGYGLSTGSNNTFLGTYTASTTATGSNNIALGYDIAMPSVNGSNQLNIGNLIFGTGINGEGKTISNGNIGIGTTSPYANFAIQINGNSTNTTVFAIASSTAAYATTTLFSVANTGDVTINGSYGAPCVIGNSNGATMCSSDERLKTNITVIPNALHDIEQIKGVTFNWADPTKNQSQFIGVIAQDVQKVFPQAVAMLPNGFLGVDYATLVAPLIEAVKEIGAISGEFKSNLIAWLGNATNGITDFFATNGHFSNELCVGSTCVTESQLKTMLQNSGQQSNPPPSGGGGDSPAPAVLTTVTVSTPAPMTVGATQTLTATGVDQYSAPIALTPTWSSSDTAVATADASTGAVTAVAAGTAVITATSGSVHGDSETLTVTDVPADPPADPVTPPAE